MRITESRMLDLASSQVSDARDRAAQAQGVMSNGMRVSKPSDDVAAWSQGKRDEIRKSMSEQRGQAINLAIDGLQSSESSLSSVSNALSQLGALATQAGNGTIDATDRQSIATQVRALRDSAIASLNRQGPDGTYLMSGSNGNAQPFSSAGVYQGDTTERDISSDENTVSSSTVSGFNLTAASGSGNVDVMSVFDQLANQLDANDLSSMPTTMDAIKTAIGQVAKTRSMVGERMSALQSADSARQSFEDNLATSRSHQVEVDPIAAVSDLTRAANVLEASRASAQQIVSLLNSR